jgi:predicted SnoaL-like aldol condensation-catalyzing enzyme
VVGGFALATALVLLLLANLWSVAGPNVARAVDDRTTTTTRQAVTAFYAAINALLATGEPAGLVTAMNPAFVDHAAGAPQPHDRAELIAALLAVRERVPGLRLRVAALLVDGDQALVYLEVANPDAESHTDPVALSATSMLDAVRVTDGLVVEHWSDGTWPEATAVSTPSPTPEANVVTIAPTPATMPAEHRSLVPQGNPSTRATVIRFPRRQT